MAAMKELWEEINYLLDTTRWSCDEIANYCSCPVDWVNEIVDQRWQERVMKSESLSPYMTCNS
jgi:hypothetical protein